MTKSSDIVTGLESYAARLKIEFKHAAKCLSEFRRCHMTASIYDLGRLSIGDYRNLRTILADARRDGAPVGDLLAEIEKRREQHDAGLRRLKDADTRTAETTGQATEKEKAIEDALLDFIDCVHEELDFIRRTSAHGLLTNGEPEQDAMISADALTSTTTSTGESAERKPKKRSAPTCGYSPSDSWAKALFIAAAKLITDNDEMGYCEAVKLAARKSNNDRLRIRLMFDTQIHGRSRKALESYMSGGYRKAKWSIGGVRQIDGKEFISMPLSTDPQFVRLVQNFANALPDFMRSKDWKDIGYSGKSKKRKRRTP